jgi:predicted RecA/RadA family phage recombinase
MAVNERFRDADKLSLPVPAGTVSGSPVKIGSLMGVTQTNRATATEFGGGNTVGSATVWLRGIFDLTVTGAVTNIGDPVYIDASNALSVTSAGNTLFGYALVTKAAPASVVPIRITQV